MMASQPVPLVRDNSPHRPSSSLHLHNNTPDSEPLAPHRKDRLNTRQSQKQLVDYSDRWENKVLQQLAEDLSQKTYIDSKFKQIEYQRDRYPREIRFNIYEKEKKPKRREMEKYRAYAVKMKIPSFKEIKKNNKEHREPNTISTHYLRIFDNLIHPRLNLPSQTAFREHHRKNLASQNNKATIQISSQQKRREIKTSAKERKQTIRKRSIKQSQKKKEVNPVSKKIESHYLRNSVNSPKGYKQFRDKLLRQSSKEDNTHPNSQKLPRKQYRKSVQEVVSIEQKSEETKVPITTVSPRAQDNATYLQKGISFKKKSTISAIPQKNIKEPIIFPFSNFNPSDSYQPKLDASQDFTPYTKEPPNKMIKKVSKDLSKNKEIERKVSKQIQSPNPLKQNKAKILVFNSQDRYVKRILCQRGWAVHHDNRSNFHHLKWVFKPVPQDYNHLTDKQFLNHVKNSHQLTSKHYLNKNLKQFLSQWPSLYSCYPKCYDFSKPDQKQQFQEQYTLNFMFVLLRRLQQYISEKQPEKYKYFYLKYKNLLLRDGSYDTDSKLISQMRKKQFRNIDFENFKYFDPNFRIHTNLTILTLKYFRNIRKRQELQEDENFHFLTFRPREFQQHFWELEAYSKQGATFDSNNHSEYFIKEYFSTPNDLAIQRIVKEYVYFENRHDRQWETFGSNNTWIIKPCSASRGNGIYLDNNLNQILYNSKGIQSKIVQQYIQKPLLLQNPHLNHKKFDIRQWVLLRSVQPLQLYIFSHCYIRICSDIYDPLNINNLQSHLTNYSFNKKFFKNRSESVLDHDSFVSILKEEKGVDFQKIIRPKIQQIIIKSIKSAQQHLHDLDKRCFSLLGYDILLDQGCNPWLLQINMSPACEQRTPWLKQYLQQMGEGMLRIILPEQYLEEDKNTVKAINNNNSQSLIKQHLRIKTEISQEFKETDRCQLPRDVIDPRQNYDQPEGDAPQIEQILSPETQQVPGPDAEQIDSPETVTQNENQQWEKLYTFDFEDHFKEEIERETAKIKQIPQNRNQDILQKEVPQSEREVAVAQEEARNINPITTPLRWELLCNQQYLLSCKKQPENFEAVGVKISSKILKIIDISLDQFQQERDQICSSVVTIQKKIRAFLALKRSLKQQKVIKGIALLGRKMRKLSDKDSKSVTLNGQISSSIWHYDYLHTFRDKNNEKKYLDVSPQANSYRKSYKDLSIRASPQNSYRGEQKGMRIKTEMSLSQQQLGVVKEEKLKFSKKKIDVKADD